MERNRRLLSQLDDFDQHVIIGDAASNGQQNNMVNNGPNDRKFTVDTNDSISTTNDNVVFV